MLVLCAYSTCDSLMWLAGGLESNERQQLYYLSKKSGPLRNVQVMQAAYKFLAEPWTFDVEGNLVLQEYSYIRVPLIIQADVEVGRELASCMANPHRPY